MRAYREAVRLHANAQFLRAIERFEASLARGGPGEALRKLGDCYERLGDPERAVSYYQRYLATPDPLAAQVVREHVELLRDRPSALRVTSSPPGAAVFLDVRGGKPVGTTPTGIEVPAGEHSVALVLAGYEVAERRVRAGFGRPLAVDLTLAPLPPKEGKLDFSANIPDAWVLVDGGVVGIAPLSLSLTAGKHLVEARSAGYDSLQREIEVRENQEARVHLELLASAAGPLPDSRLQTIPAVTTVTVTPPARGYGIHLALRYGPAFMDYGADNLSTGATQEGAFELGGTIGKRAVALDIALIATLSPVLYGLPQGGDGRAWFVSTLAMPGLRIRAGDKTVLRVGVGLGASVLAGAGADSPFFSAPGRVSTPFGFAVRPEVDLDVRLWNGLWLSIQPFGVCYSPRFSALTNPDITHILRLSFSLGLRYQLL